MTLAAPNDISAIRRDAAAIRRWLRATTRASATLVEAAPGPVSPAALDVFVPEFDASYRWVAGDETAADHYRVLGHTGGAEGRWILSGDRITLRPLGGVLDDWARVMAACAAMAGHGTVVLMNHGALVPWRVDSEQVTPSGATIDLGGSHLVSTLTPNPSEFTGSVFFNTGGTEAANTTTLSADAVASATTVTVASASGIAVGDRISIRRGSLWATAREVAGKVGNVLTLDRPLLRPFVSGDGVVVVETCKDITIRGGGARISGTGDAVVMFVAGWDCHVEGLRVDSTMTYGMVFDIGTRDSTISKCVVDCNATSESAFQFDAVETCSIIDCHSERSASNNIVFASCINSHVVRGAHGRSVGDGMELTVLDETDTIGSRGCTVDGTAFVGNAGSGIRVQNGSSDNTFTGVDLSYNQGGVTFTAGACRNSLTGRARGNTQVAVLAAGSTTLGNRVDLSCDGHDVGVFQATGGADLLVGGSINDSSVVGSTASMIHADGAGTVVRVAGIRALTTRASAGQGFCQVTNGAEVEICGPSRYQSVTDFGIGVRVDSGLARISGLKVTAPAGYGIWLNGVAALVRQGDGCDFSGAGTPVQNTNGKINRGTVVLNGATPVAVAFSDTKATDRCKLNRKTPGGTMGHFSSGDPSAGVGFSVVGTALDTSVLEFEIG